MRDADIETRDLAELANGLEVARRHGVCSHDSLMRLTCRDCGRTFVNDQEWADARDDVISEWT